MLHFALLVCLAGAQEFDAASIRPSQADGSRTSIQMSKGGFRASNLSLYALILNAYDVQPVQLIGLENWMKDLRYDITANFEEDESKSRRQRQADQQARLRNLLATRFQLKMREETRELPGFALVLDKPGQHKMKAVESEGGNTRMNQSNGSGSFFADAIQMASLADTIGGIVDRTVVDETGLGEKRFQVELRWADPAANAEGGPTIYTSLKEQLGLRLESKKAPTKVLVIERASKPSEN